MAKNNNFWNETRRDDHAGTITQDRPYVDAMHNKDSL